MTTKTGLNNKWQTVRQVKKLRNRMRLYYKISAILFGALWLVLLFGVCFFPGLPVSDIPLGFNIAIFVITVNTIVALFLYAYKITK